MEEKEKQNGKRYKKQSKAKKIILIILMVLLIFIIILLGIAAGLVMAKIGKIDYNELDESQLGINDNLYDELTVNISKEEFENIKNVALFGVDGGRSDAIIIASINQTDKTIKLLSIPRDTYVEVKGYGKTKINHAYAYGKEQLALQTINSNFGLNISEYVTINFKGLINVINKIGGIELTISKEEKDYINQYVNQSYALTGKNVKLLSSYGKVKLTGEQALTHSRNRTIGSDFARSERQRDVITAAMSKVMQKSITEIWSISDSILEEVRTNLNVSECMGIVANVLPNASTYLNNVISLQVPSTEIGSGQTISGVYYFVCDLDKASQDFKDAIYGE